MGRRRTPSLLAAGALLLALGWLTSGCATKGAAYKGKPTYTERGLASWYGPGFHGNRAANGEIYDMNEMTAAHRTLPFDTVVEVRNRDNGQRVEVRITDRGPFVKGRIIDLSKEAARRLDMLGPGVAPVEIRVVTAAPGARTAGGRFWVQAGAFRDKAEARRLESRLKRDFDDVRIDSDGAWHRVRLGPFSQRQQAERTQRDLERRGIDAFVTRL